MNQSLAVIIVDDLKFNRFAIRGILKHFTCEIFEANNGQEALDLLKVLKQSKILMLLDIEMPVLSGIEVLKILKEQPPQNLFVVITSSNDYFHYRNELQYFDVLGYLEKPIEKKSISQFIEYVLKN
ncbi:response regulator [Flectobacillus sp. DC10W]|jgi:two-component system response regulator YesN|uniref:Response regulator n=1 Tax=Flectobacillus longus TaxID=2984207 RepID=A0ABT6YHP9_9BACT|nr:response regulator [Flectobacillus longus]MDI9863105.1 response regulator [Flectobacillus longus]